MTGAFRPPERTAAAAARVRSGMAARITAQTASSGRPCGPSTAAKPNSRHIRGRQGYTEQWPPKAPKGAGL